MEMVDAMVFFSKLDYDTEKRGLQKHSDNHACQT